MIHKLNLEIPDGQLKKKFNEFDTDNSKTLDFEEFSKLFATVQSLPDVSKLFKDACGNGEDMVAEELQRLIRSLSLGKQNFSIPECAKLIYMHEGMGEDEASKIIASVGEDDDDQFLEGPVLSYEGFQRLMTDHRSNAVMDATKYNTVYQDMTRPLSEYFVSSSHNTYLAGNQLNSESTPAAISHALKLGVRVIELDAWDGSSVDEGPIVNHGHTLCKPTSLKSCLEAIKQDGFKASQYPVIITIENHCSLPFQKVQMDLLTSIFGDQLFKWTGREVDGKVDWAMGPEDWLSPEELKGKVVIRDKPKKKDSSKANKALEKAAKQQAENAADDAVLSEEIQLELDDDDGEDDVNEAASKLNVDERLLKHMYIKNVKIKSTVKKDDKQVDFVEPPFASSSSLGENKMLKLTKPGFQARDLATYAHKHLVRVYPAGSRTASSNYDPTPAWNAGCQIVALNYQTGSLPVWLNQGKFSDNGGCGYVLKPEVLQRVNASLPEKWDAQPKQVLNELTVTVVSGHYLPKPLGKSVRSEVIDPYVQVGLHGVAADTAKFETKSIDNNGFNPSWNEKFTFKITAPELALVSFIVNDHDVASRDDLIAQAVVPVTAIVPGFKMVPLFLENGAPSDSYLFCRFEFSPGPPFCSTD